MLNKFFILILFLSLSAISCRQETSNPNTQNESKTKDLRIVSLSGFLTETLSVLGHGDKIVGRDVTSTYPKAINELPSLGHVTSLNPEALLGIKPDLIFVEEKDAKRAEVLGQLENSGIKIVKIATSHHLGNAENAARQIAEHLPTEKQKINALFQKTKADSIALATLLAETNTDEKVLFIYARGAGTLLVAGNNTAAADVIHMAGAKNAMTTFNDFKPLTPEALLESQPDVILMFDSGLASLAGKEGLAKVPGMAKTPAFINNRVITMDGHYLTAFGPRAGEAVLELSEKIKAGKPVI